jgi:hypothetical protein
MKRRSKLDLHLQSRVPKSVEAFDARFPLIRTALGTNDLALARRQRDRLAEADDA